MRKNKIQTEKSIKQKKLRKIPVIITTVVVIMVLGTGGVFTCKWFLSVSKSQESDASLDDQKMNMKNRGDMMENVVSSTGTTSAGSIYQSTALSGTMLIVEDVYVAAGDKVEEGSKLLKVTDESLSNALVQLEKLAETAERKLTQAKADYSDNLMDARYTYQDSVSAGTTAKDVYDAKIDELQSAADKAKENYENAKDIIENYPDKIKAEKTSLKETKEKLAAAQARLLDLQNAKTECEQTLRQAETANNKAQNELSWAQETVNYVAGYISSKGSDTALSSLLTDAQSRFDQKQKTAETAKTEYENASKALSDATAKAEEGNKNVQSAQNEVAALTSELTSMKSELSQAKEKLEEYSTSYSETKTALETGKVTAKQEYETNKLTAQSASTQYQTECTELKTSLDEKQEASNTAEENLEAFKSSVGDGYIYSSQSGTLSSVSARTGDIISDKMPVAGYYEMDTIDVAVSVDQSDIANIAVGDSATITGNSNKTGTVSMIETVRAESSVSDVYYTVTVSVDNSDEAFALDESVAIMIGMQDMQNMNNAE